MPTSTSTAETGTRPHFADTLIAAVERVGSPICVGLDPDIAQLPASLAAKPPVEAIDHFGRAVLDAVAGVVPAVKFQSACYERYGWRGVQVLEQHMGLARERGLVVILDAKRGDIGTTSAHYAAAAANAGAHAITVNGYLGRSSTMEFLKAGLGVFVLVRTSNPDSDLFQTRRLHDGRTIAEIMATDVELLGEKHMGTRGFSNVGAVVGATKAADGEVLRAIMDHQVFLVPGYGAQGATAADIAAFAVPERTGVADCGLIVNASRSVIYAGGQDADWQQKVTAAAKAFANDVTQAVTSA